MMSSKGFSVVEVLIVIVIVAMIGFSGYYVSNRNNSDAQLNVDTADSSKTSEELPINSYKGAAKIWLSGATDDNFINYYKLDFELNDLKVGCADTPTVNTKTEYTENKLNVIVGASVERVEAPMCLSLPRAYSGSIDINKDWLSSDEENLEINFNGDTHQLIVDNEKYVWYLDENNIMPFYPDNVAIVRVGLQCNSPTGISTGYVTESSLKLATETYKGIEAINRAPSERELIIYDDKAKTAHQSFLNEYQGGMPGGSFTKFPSSCTPYISKPILTQNMDFQ